jgi:hypothetical protein
MNFLVPKKIYENYGYLINQLYPQTNIICISNKHIIWNEKYQKEKLSQVLHQHFVNEFFRANLFKFSVMNSVLDWKKPKMEQKKGSLLSTFLLATRG